MTVAANSTAVNLVRELASYAVGSVLGRWDLRYATGERQEDLISEPRAFEDKLRRAANLHLEPDLNDGIVLNITPLHELVPWKKPRITGKNSSMASTSGSRLASRCGRMD